MEIIQPGEEVILLNAYYTVSCGFGTLSACLFITIY